MKMNKKKVFVTALVVCLVAILSMGSLAWFSAQDNATNKFYVADSTDTKPEDIFSVEVFERVDTDGDGEKDAALFENGFDYKDVLPGDLLVKEPVVRNTGYYSQYIRAIVTISDATAWLNAVGENIDMSTVFIGFDETKWTNIQKKTDDGTDTMTYVLYYDGILESGKDITLFTNVKIPESLTQAQAVAFGGDFTIDVKAQAVQTENVGETAYAAFQTVGMAY